MIGGFACPASLQAQPWFENQVPGIGTSGLATNFGSLFQTNNAATLFLQMSALRLSRGLPAYNNLQLLAILMATDGGISNYHAMFATLRNRSWHGLQFDLNYTLSKAHDQIGDVQNNLSGISSGFDRDIDYGPSQADRRHIFNGVFTYDLPFGSGKRWSSSNGVVGRIIDGWYTSGIYRAYSSLPYFVTDNNGTVWGGTLAGIPAQGAIPTGDRSALDAGVHAGVGGSGGVGTAGNPGTNGSGLNLFPDPEAAFKSFRRTLISQDGRQGRANYFRGPGFWNLDFRVGKQTRITERVRFEFSFDFFNVFNHVNLSAPSLSLNSPANFGVFTTQVVPGNRTEGSRWIQFGSRVTF